MHTKTHNIPLSIIVPMLNEAAGIEQTLRALAPMRARGVEVIVADGGSSDCSASIAAALADVVIDAPRGRAKQMNAGAAASRGAVLLFLHADTVLPDQADGLILQALAAQGRAWGRFDVRICGRSRMLPVVAALMNMRSRLTGIATGDQAMFVRRANFFAAGAFPAQPLMEDIELSRRLKARSAPACLAQRVTTSGRRWETKGVWRTIFLMWSLRLRYWFGAGADTLERVYRR
ncbi:TIGR04283 family arsenosugar biosynthesis glycosyltransferase [Massilia glaciei]|uniref:Glycosyl transferase n=1 Tax=Massilia glaciei TaxID=1524097 RepID=A0A2U2HGJ2_9BURK|nr:TIGR04283 family arsenosugar biosynthesis glycosyltransferase [Massilia glaciei]PWF44035.1 glycosyl transferase [Massilia glaciei]